MNNSAQNDLHEVSTKLNILISILLGVHQNPETSKGKEKRRNVADYVYFLADMGMDPKEIATVLKSPLGTVRTLLTPKRRKG